MFAVDQAAIVYSEVSYDNAICHADPTVTSFPNVLYLQRSCLKPGLARSSQTCCKDNWTVDISYITACYVRLS